jgi:hypothetical protein
MPIHIQLAHSVADFDQWIEFFSFTRSGVRKGIIELREVP